MSVAKPIIKRKPKKADKTKPAPFYILMGEAAEREHAAKIAAPDEPATITQTEQALQVFASQVEQIPNVIRIRRYRIGRSNEEGVMVVVANLFSPVTHEVIRAQERVYDAMPGVRFSLDIKDASTIEHSEL